MQFQPSKAKQIEKTLGNNFYKVKNSIGFFIDDDVSAINNAKKAAGLHIIKEIRQHKI